MTEWPAPSPCVADVDGIPMSALVAEAANPRATVVAIHGGATTSAYYDCPGHPRLSFLRIGRGARFHRDRVGPSGFRRVRPERRADDRPGSTRRTGVRGGRRHPRLSPTRRGIVRAGPLQRVRTHAADGGRRTGLCWASRPSGTGRRNQPAAHAVLSRPNDQRHPPRRARTALGRNASLSGRGHRRRPVAVARLRGHRRRQLAAPRLSRTRCASARSCPVQPGRARAILGERSRRAGGRRGDVHRVAARGRQRTTRQRAQPEPRVHCGCIPSRRAVVRRGVHRRSAGRKGSRTDRDYDEVESEAS